MKQKLVKTILGFLLLFLTWSGKAQHSHNLGATVLWMDRNGVIVDSPLVNAPSVLIHWLTESKIQLYSYDTLGAHLVVYVAPGVPFSADFTDFEVGGKRYRPHPVIVLQGWVVRVKQKNSHGDFIVVSEKLYDEHWEPAEKRFTVLYHSPIF